MDAQPFTKILLNFDKHLEKRPKYYRAFFMIMSSAPAAGFEPATNALHVFQYFRIGVDYIFTIFRIQNVNINLGTLVSSLYGAPDFRRVPSVLA